MTVPKKIDGWLSFHPDAEHQCDSYVGERLLLSELVILGWAHFSRAMINALHADTHDQAYEIHCMVGGELDLWVEDMRYKLTAGDVIVTRPGALHGAKHGVIQPSEYYWLQFKQPGRVPLRGYSAGEWKLIRRSLDRLPSHVFRASDNVRRCFQQLIEEHRQPSPTGLAMCRSLFNELLLWIVRGINEQGAGHARNGKPITYAIRKAIGLIHERAFDEEQLSIGALAKAVGLSESAFRRRFYSDVGTAPNTYMNRRRMEKAMQLLGEKKSVTEAAFMLGFGSSQHFATAFKKVTGFSPSEYVAQSGRT